MEIPKAYEAKASEDAMYRLWEKSGCFAPYGNGKPFTIIMPPPNANGALHIGHALFLTIEDILIRYHRMRGERTLWQPGTDHAGFETQVVYEKKLEKEDRSRFQLSREELYKEIWDFVQENKHHSENGIRRLGASCDWSRNIFTLDSRIVKIVYETFQEMYADGLVYRGSRICNWCPKHQTALSDLETKYQEREDTLYYLKYGPFTIATARPETKFGDKFVVMHPDDTRYAQYQHGQKIELEWINGNIIATVIKDDTIDREFGTGVMTITPWHDAVDFEIARRHHLPMEQIIDKAGKLLPISGEFSGMHIKKARLGIVEKLKSKGLVDESKTDPHYKHNVQACYRCGTPIEPQIIPQWFVAVTKSFSGKPSLRDMAVEAVESGKIKIVPERMVKIYMHWMKNIYDWPISRQIAWGIPIPAWFRGEEIKIQETSPGEGWVQDPDTFDTWFSSGQWPFATLMANDKKDFETFYPTSVMETGWDILFFWVARMIMMGLYKTGEVPFHTVYLHGLVRDKDRQKMSKSKGNVVDPLGVIDLYGADALRFGLIYENTAGNDIIISEEKIRGMRNFVNKLWNIGRFLLMNQPQEEISEHSELSEEDKAMRKKLNELSKEITRYIEEYRFGQAAERLYGFVWHEFADQYLESTKNNIPAHWSTLVYSFETCLKLLHPFAPFITEILWQKFHPGTMLMTQKWPFLTPIP